MTLLILIAAAAGVFACLGLRHSPSARFRALGTCGLGALALGLLIMAAGR